MSKCIRIYKELRCDIQTTWKVRCIKATIKGMTKKKQERKSRQVTHTCVLLDALEKVFGGHQEVDEVAQAVSAVQRLHHVQDLAEYSGSRGLERWVEGRKCALDAAVQRFRIL